MLLFVASLVQMTSANWYTEKEKWHSQSLTDCLGQKIDLEGLKHRSRLLCTRRAVVPRSFTCRYGHALSVFAEDNGLDIL